MRDTVITSVIAKKDTIRTIPTRTATMDDTTGTTIETLETEAIGEVVEGGDHTKAL